MSHSTTRMPSGYWAMALLLLIGSAAQATDFVRVPDAALRWAGGDPVDGPAFASADAPTWQMGEVGRKEAFRSDVVWVSVPVPKGDYRAPVLFLDGLSGIVELWTDGRRLYASSWDAGVSSTEIVSIPVSALGERVELRIAGAVSRPMLSSVSLTEHELATREIVRRGFPSVMTAVLMLAVALAALLAWATTRDNRFPLFISIFSLASAAMSHGLGAAPAHFLPWLDWKLALQVGASAFPWAIIVLLRAGFPDSAPPWARWVERLTFGWMLTFFITFLFPALAALQLLAMVPFLAAIVTSIVIAAKAGLKGDIDGRRLVGAMLVLLSIISYDSLAQLGLRSPTGFHLHWGLISMTAAFVLIFTRRTAESAKALRDHTRRLAEREQESRALMTRLLTDAQELRAAVGDLRHSGDSQNEVIEKQAAALQETQVTAEEIRRTSTLAAEKAQALLEQANVVEQTQRAGEQAVEESMTGLSSIGDEVASMARSMNAVDALAQEISGILDVVRDLADQSNMLALNAAIEAVRSGEHGKGFAVVAREVRRLADQSLTATDRIRNALGRLDEGVKESSLAGARGERSIAQAIERLRGSGEQMRSMSEILRDTNASVRQISAAVTQQNAGISQIFAAVEHLSAQMQEAVQRVQDAQSATIVVENVAGRMAEQKQAA